jgi:hypothetical protein
MALARGQLQKGKQPANIKNREREREQEFHGQPNYYQLL